MRTFDTKTKNITKRALGHGAVLLVSDQGDISNHETTVWRGERRPRRWVSVNTSGNVPRSALIQRADSLSLKGDDVLVRQGKNTTKLKGEAVTEPSPVMQKPEGASFTVDAWRGENREAIKALVECSGRDASLPVLTAIQMQSQNGGIRAYGTDRYRLAEARMETVSKSVEFSALVPRFVLHELTTNRAWHLSVWENFTIAEFCETGVRVQTTNLQGDYPKVADLFTEHPDEQIATWTVTPRVFAKAVKDLHPPRHNPVALSSDGLIGAEGAGHVRPAGVVSVKAGEKAEKWVAVEGVYLEGLLRAVSDYEAVDVWWGEHMKPVHVVATDRLRLLLMPVRGVRRSFPVSDIFEG